MGAGACAVAGVVSGVEEVFSCRQVSPSDVWRVLCELYAKLMGVVMGHWLLFVCRGDVWDRSLYKTARAFQRLSVVVAVCWCCLRRV